MLFLLSCSCGSSSFLFRFLNQICFSSSDRTRVGLIPILKHSSYRQAGHCFLFSSLTSKYLLDLTVIKNGHYLTSPILLTHIFLLLNSCPPKESAARVASDTTIVKSVSFSALSTSMAFLTWCQSIIRWHRLVTRSFATIRLFDFHFTDLKSLHYDYIFSFTTSY